MTIRAATRARLESAHRYSAVYRGYLASHLPMALVALDALGADDARIDAFARKLEAHLEPLEGDAAFSAELAAVTQALARDGREATLRRELARLLEAPGSGAFHGAIRTAYAIESGSDRELAHALAYWRVAFDPLGEAIEARGHASPREVLAAIAADAGFAGVTPEGRNIATRMQAARAHPRFTALVAQADPAKLTLDRLAQGALHAYAASGSFTLLHAVTGCHALRLLSPWMERPGIAVAHAWQALAAAFIASGSPPMVSLAFAPEAAASWPAIHAAAVASDDEHDVKLAYTAWREWQRTGDDLYRRAAAARLRSFLTEAMH